MAKKTKRKTKQDGLSRGFGSQSLVTELAHVEALLRREQWLDAYALLKRLKVSHPKHVDVLRYLLDVHHELGHMRQYQTTCEEFLVIKPNDAQVNFLLGYAYLFNYYPLLGTKQYRYAVDRWPDHPESVEGKENLAKLEPNLSEILDTMKLSYPEDLEFGLLYERAQAYTETGQAEKALPAAQRLVQQRSNFVAGYNILALAYLLAEQYDDAIATLQASLEQHPDSILLRAMLIRIFCMRGNFMAAEAHKAPLLANSSFDPDDLTRQAEALAYLDDMEAIIEILATVPPDPDMDNRPLVSGVFHHLAAVALTRQGDPKAARQQWKFALELYPDLAIAKENLDDLEMVSTAQQGPWPFALSSWVENGAYQDLRQVAITMTPEQTPRPALVAAVDTLLANYPFISQLVPVWLKRGSPRARMLAVLIVKSSPQTLHIDAANDFVASTCGNDAQRYHMAVYLAKQRQLTTTQLWLQGKWYQQLQLPTYEIVPDAPVTQSADVQTLLDKALKKIALESTNAAKTAEDYLTQALTLEPDNPALLNSLAIAYTQQERLVESRQLTQQTIDQHPEDIDSRIAIAQLYLQEENLAAAETVLNKLLARSTWTEDDLVSLMLTYSRLLMLQDREEMARLWFQEVLPLVQDHPILRQLGNQTGSR